MLSLISRWRNSSGDTLKSDDPDLAALAKRLVSDYRQTLKASNAVDFDDLILLVLQLFGEHPAALEECRDRYRYIMVDEYQDTNGSQFDLVHSLAKENRNFCVVGDDDQSIYGYSVEVTNQVEREIIEVVNSTIVQSEDQKYKALLTIFEDLTPLIVNTNGTVAKYRIEIEIKYELLQIDSDEVISTGTTRGFAQYDVTGSEIVNEDTKKSMTKIATKNAIQLMTSRIQSSISR